MSKAADENNQNQQTYNGEQITGLLNKKLDPAKYHVAPAVEIESANSEVGVTRIKDVVNNALDVMNADKPVTVIPIRIDGNKWIGASVSLTASGELNIVFQDPSGTSIRNQSFYQPLQKALGEAYSEPVVISDVGLKQRNEPERSGALTVENLAIMADVAFKEDDPKKLSTQINGRLGINLNDSMVDLKKEHAKLLEPDKIYAELQKESTGIKDYLGVAETLYKIVEQDKLTLEQKKTLIKGLLSNPDLKLTPEQAAQFKRELPNYIDAKYGNRATTYPRLSEQSEKDIAALMQSDIPNLLKAVDDRAAGKDQKTAKSVAPDPTPPEQPKPATPPVNRVAMDSIAIGDPSANKQPDTPSRTQFEGKSFDEIVKLVREEILQKQKDFVLNAILEDNSKPELQKLKEKLVLAKNEEVSVILADPKLRDAVTANIQDKPALKAEWSGLQAKETEAYSKILSTQNGFKNVDWSQDVQREELGGKTTLTKPVISKEGTKLLDLKQTTVATIGNLTVDGQEIKGYRTIDFPNKAEGGPVHVAIAVKDVNGNNIDADKAVYFTAHYDKEGKLQEVSTPQPVKFSSNDPDAIGYIEKDGQVYTLPVTKSKYEELTHQLAINKGIELEHKVEKAHAQDIVQVGQDTPPVSAIKPPHPDTPPPGWNPQVEPKAANIEQKKDVAVGEGSKAESKVLADPKVQATDVPKAQEAVLVNPEDPKTEKVQGKVKGMIHSFEENIKKSASHSAAPNAKGQGKSSAKGDLSPF